MAYDKVVDSSVLDAGLKQIADAIREKGGTSDNLAFPQAMADAIAAIEAGGDLPNGAFYIGHGSFTPAQKTQNYNIFTIEELRNIASQNTAGKASYFSLIVRIKNLAYSDMTAAVIYCNFWVNPSNSIQGVDKLNACFSKNYSGTLSRESLSSGESTMNATTGLTLNTPSSYQFAPTEYVWTLVGYTGV